MADTLPAKPAVADPAAAWRGRRRRQDHGTKREAVIRSAARAFDQRGYHNTSLDDIAAALGVTKPTIYYYVANKEQLLFECFLAGLEPIRSALRRAEQTPGTGRDRLREVVRDYAVAIASEYGWCMVRAEHQDLGPELSGQVRALKSEIDRGIRRLLQAGINDGSVAIGDTKLAAFAIAGALNWIAHWYRAGRTLTSLEVADAFVQFLEQGLAPRAAGGGDRGTAGPARARRTRASAKA
jgi:AcrR family transcriptional regulator